MPIRTKWTHICLWALAGPVCATLLFSGVPATTQELGARRAAEPRLSCSHPAVLAGRLTRSSAPGRYVDVHAPLTREEAAPLAHYLPPRGPRDPRPGPAAGTYVDLGAPERIFRARPRRP